MALRGFLSLLCWFGVGSQALVAQETGGKSAAALWQQGQAAMKDGQPQKAVGFYEQSLAADPAFTRNHLSLAAACLETGNDAEACVHLGQYVALHPEQLVIRTHYIELLLRLQRRPEACAEWERFIAHAQERGDEALGQLIHCHTRLMALAEADDDDYGAHLHRGIGLYLLARERAALAQPDGDLSSEGLLCKAAGELTMARAERPGEARPCWYLHAVWSRLGQQQPARRCLREAAAAAPFTYLTPAEQRSLQLAARAGSPEPRPR
jgi:tetratricopeptide (TPR) repeat protein